MQIHKKSLKFPGTLCGACIVSEKYLAELDSNVTCSECLEIMGEANSKQKSTMRHKCANNLTGTLCGVAVMSESYRTNNPVLVTCPDCHEKMQKRSSEEQNSGTYTSLPIQPWHFSEVNSLSFLEGCVVKRVCRHRLKDGAQDIDKAIEELKLLKDHLYGH